jgi:hypothetical protein
MKTLKVAFFAVHDIADIQNSVFFHLLKDLSIKKIEIVNINRADILIVGPYDAINYKRILFNKLCNIKTFKNFFNYFPNFDIYSFDRKYKPLRIFLSSENIHENLPKYNYSFNHDLGIVNDKHFRFPHWKDHIDWSHEGVKRKYTLTSKRFGNLWNLDDLLKPQGEYFLNKKKKMCLITSHMIEPRMSIYLKFKQHFDVDGFGSYFQKEIQNHNNSNFKIKDILESYAFNLCPENSLFQGYYSDKVPNAFLSKTLPITWADQNIDADFNVKAFINLIDYAKNDYDDICNLLKDDNYLLNYSKEPLLLERPNLDKERIFIQKILSSL